MTDLFKNTNEQTLLVCTAPELVAAFRSVLSQFLDEREEQKKDTYISRSAASKRLGKDLSTLYRWQQAKMLHPVKRGRSIYYLESEITRIEKGSHE